MRARPTALVLAALAAGTVLTTTVPAATAFAAPAAKTTSFDYDGFNVSTGRFKALHPDDIVGLKREYATWGVQLQTVTIPALGVRSASPEAAQAAINRAKTVAPQAVPVDAFSVRGGISLLSNGQYLVEGDWNFRDNYVNGSAPDDLAELAVRSSCYRIASTRTYAADYQGVDYTSRTYISKTDTSGDTVAGVRDTASGFKLLTDNGNVRYFMSSRSCVTRDFDAAFNYEHNQDGGNIISFSFGFGFINVNYGGGPSVLEKSSGTFH